MTDPSFLTFDELLERFFDHPAAEAELVRRYGTRCSVLVMDFTGMVRRTDAYGIGYALALAAAAQRTVQPALAAHGGVMVKRVADTAFVVFDQPEKAMLAALDAHRALAAFNEGRTGHIGHPDRNDPIHACIGIGYGDALVVPGRDLFGAEVNRAFVLGEDVADGRETLVSEAFLHALGTPPVGVGSFRAPAEREEEAGFPFHLVADHR